MYTEESYCMSENELAISGIGQLGSELGIGYGLRG